MLTGNLNLFFYSLLQFLNIYLKHRQKIRIFVSSFLTEK